MKKNILHLLLMFNFLFADSQNVLQIGNKQISLEEFENIFYKNNHNEDIDKDYLDEYIQLFINFKLKVFEAESLYMDTLSTFIKELDGYNKQLEKPYLRNKEFDEQMIIEAYNRMLYDVRASHILISQVDGNMIDDKNEKKAYEKALSIRNEIINNKMNFSDAAKKYSNDPSAVQNGGDLGYFTAFMMVYDFESAVYNLELDEVSMPIKTKYGYHIIMLHDKRKAFGEVQVAHIMFKKNKVKKDNDIARSKIEDIVSKLDDGQNFAELAERFSEDRSSAVKGGKLPPFGVNKMVPEFESVAFSLDSIGDISHAFETEFGWHVIILLDKKGIPNFEEISSEISKKISRDSRGELSKISLYKKLKEEYKVVNNVKVFRALRKVAFNKVYEGNWDGKSNIDDVLFTIDTSKVMSKEFISYILENQKLGADFDILYQDFVNEKLLQYEKVRLKYKYPKYRALLNEYREGILLFDITNQKVWNKAINDTIGLEEFFMRNIGGEDSVILDYMWGDRVDATIYTCANKSVALKVKFQLLKKSLGVDLSDNDVLKLINKDAPLNLQINAGKFEKGDNKYIDQIAWDKGLSSDINLSDGMIVLVYINNFLPGSNKELKDIRGKVIADYQSYLEREWIAELRKKYSIIINTKVLYSLIGKDNQ